ncbi:YciI family protein [Pseudonocardia acaciae]|uniref:YciI family protein n=1 Tax=Pseudonocardia acaciae TaxID=551276 RepID=UPI00048BA35C|nr:YciI family protein [Pseudonocardia acaciae]
MPRYVILLYERERTEPVPPEIAAACARVPEQIEAMGAKIINDQAPEPVAATRSISKDGMVTDGPFLESKEVLAGFFVVEARDMDQAVAIGKLIPVMDGGVEVRPLFHSV